MLSDTKNVESGKVEQPESRRSWSQRVASTAAVLTGFTCAAFVGSPFHAPLDSRGKDEPSRLGPLENQPKPSSELHQALIALGARATSVDWNRAVELIRDSSSRSPETTSELLEEVSQLLLGPSAMRGLAEAWLKYEPDSTWAKTLAESKVSGIYLPKVRGGARIKIYAVLLPRQAEADGIDFQEIFTEVVLRDPEGQVSHRNWMAFQVNPSEDIQTLTFPFHQEAPSGIGPDFSMDFLSTIEPGSTIEIESRISSFSDFEMQTPMRVTHRFRVEQNRDGQLVTLPIQAEGRRFSERVLDISEALREMSALVFRNAREAKEI